MANSRRQKSRYSGSSASPITFRKFIPNYSTIIAPSPSLPASPTSNGPRKRQRALDELKRLLTSKPVLTLQIKRTLPHISDASGVGIRCTSRTGTKRQMAPVSLHFQKCQFPGTEIPDSRPRNARHHARSTRMAPDPNCELQTVPGLYGPYRLTILQRPQDLLIAMRDGVLN